LTAADIRIGTAGWSIPRALAEAFPRAGSHLERYARRMNAVEINTSFYRPHKRQIWERWAAATPEDFRFAVKTPRLLTHDQRLADPDAALDAFAEQVAGLGDKLAVLLVQLPPSLIFDAEVAGPFFAAVRQRFDAAVACEPRHASWFNPEADGLLSDWKVARVAADPAKVPAAGEPGGWTGLSYARLHGSPRVYYSPYPADVLADQARRLKALSARGPAWCILDNTAGGAALGDALTVMTAGRTA
jgi:uncharacterized protein YecE (DUF72 family)